MNATNYDNMIRINALSLEEWERTVSVHTAYLWCTELIGVITAAHYQIDGANVCFGEGCLAERVRWLRDRMEAAEAAREEPIP